MWNATIYEKFKTERLQPSIDLLQKVDLEECNRIIDIGCGSGMSTLGLKQKYPEAEILGLDMSEEMLKQANDQLQGVTWIRRDCSQELTDLGVFDLVFSNAFMQWIPNQDEFVMRSRRLLRKGGILAVQIPLFEEMEIAKIIKETAEEYDRDKIIFARKDIKNCFNYSMTEYYDIFSRYYPEIEIWQTDYIHQMENVRSILEFVKGTALLPYLACMDSAQIEDFMKILYWKTAQFYKVSENGMVLFPFKRLFVIGKK